MGDMGDIFNDMQAAKKKHRQMKLAEADTSGWKAFTDYHFTREFNGERMDWWPSSGVAKYKRKMIYGHKKVNALISKLKLKEAKP